MNKLKNVSLFIAMILISAVYQSCKDDDITPSTGVIVPDGNELTWGCACDNHTIDVNTELQWRIEVEDGWVTPIQTSGKGASKVEFYVEENSEDEDRTTIIQIIPDGGTAAEIRITQKGLASGGENDSEIGGYKKHGVGWGYNGYGEYADAKYITNQILNEINAKEVMGRYFRGDASIEMEDYQTTDAIEPVGTSSQDLSKELAINAQLNIDLPCGFSLGLKAGYDSEDLANESKNFANRRYKSIIRMKYMDTENLMAILTNDTIKPAIRESILSDGFKSWVNKLKANPGDQTQIKKFIERYGTHLITYAEIGGRFDYSMTTDKSDVSSKMDITAGLDMGYKKMFSIHGDAHYDESEKKIGSNYTCKVAVKGGKSSILAGASSAEEGACKTEDIIKWAESITEENSLLIDNHLVPIWYIIPDEEVAKAVEAYLTGGEYVKANPIYDLPVPKSDVSGAVEILLSSCREKLELDETLVFCASAGNSPVVEICEELIKSLGNKRVLVAYPVISNHPDYSKGFFLGDGSQAPGYVTWENNQYTYTTSDEYQSGEIIDVVYAVGSGKELELSGKKKSGVSKWIKASPQPVYADFYRANFLNNQFYTEANNLKLVGYDIVKIGQHVWTRENINTPSGIGYASLPYFMSKIAFYYQWSDKFLSKQWCIPTSQSFAEMQSLTPTGGPFIKGGSSGLDIDAPGYITDPKNDKNKKVVQVPEDTNFYYLRCRKTDENGNIKNNNSVIKVDIDGYSPIQQVDAINNAYYPIRFVRTADFEYE